MAGDVSHPYPCLLEHSSYRYLFYVHCSLVLEDIKKCSIHVYAINEFVFIHVKKKPLGEFFEYSCRREHYVLIKVKKYLGDKKTCALGREQGSLRKKQQYRSKKKNHGYYEGNN